MAESERKLEGVIRKSEREAEATGARRPGIPPIPVREQTGLQKAAFLVVVLWGISVAQPVLQPLALAALLAFLMAPLVRQLRKIRVPEALAVTISAVVLVLPIAAIVYALVNQGQALVHDFPRISQSAAGYIERFTSSSVGAKLGLANVTVSDLTHKISSSAGAGISVVVGSLGMLVNAGSHLILVLLLAVVMLGSRTHLRHSSERLADRIEGIQSGKLVDDVASLIERFLVARLLIVLIIGGLSAVALQILGLSYGIVLGGFVGIMTLVPAVGFILSLIPITLVSLATGNSIGETALTLAILVGINLIDNYYLTPKFVGRRLNLNALVTFVGLLAGGALWGIWGMLLSIPVLGVLRIAFSSIPGLQAWGELMADKEERTKHPLPHFRRLPGSVRSIRTK